MATELNLVASLGLPRDMASATQTYEEKRGTGSKKPKFLPVSGDISSFPSRLRMGSGLLEK